MLKVFIILIYYKGKKDTIECLNSITKIDHQGFDLNTVLVDNNPEERIKINEKDFNSIKLNVVKSSKNSGFSGGNNIGIKEALENKADYVLLLNNDTIVKEDFLTKLINFAESKKDAGIIAPKIYFAKGYEFHKSRYKEKELGKVIWYAGGVMDWENVIGHHKGVDDVDIGQFNEKEETEFASGCCMLIKNEVFEKVGLLDEKYFLYYEDSDFSVKAKKNDFKIYFQPESIIWHKNAGSTGGSGSGIQDYYITRNRLLFGNRYAPMRSKIALNREGISLIFSGRKMQKKGAKDYFLRRFGKMN